jgi:hypothetical protein
MSKFHEIAEDSNHGWFVNLDRVTHVRWKNSQGGKNGNADLRVEVFFAESDAELKLRGEGAAQFLKLFKEKA